MITPYKDSTESKKKQVADMFDNIAGKYDFMNHFFSVGIDILWRKKAIGIIAKENPATLLDVATGTADLAIEAFEQTKARITGIDISEGMLEVGRKKISEKNYQSAITLKQVDSENMPFEENSFDGVTVAFGVRNFENLQQGLNEMYRVIKPGSVAVILEFSKPKRFPFKQLYNLYFRNIMPVVGKVFSDDKQAYAYLPESVQAFPDGEAFLRIMQNSGFIQTKVKSLTFGIASIYTGRK